MRHYTGTKVQIIEENKAAWDLVKYKTESACEKKLDFLSYYPTPEESIGAFFLHRPDILIADLKILYNYDLDVIENLLYQNMSKTKLIVLASPNQLEGLQRVVEIGLSALILKPINSANIGRAIQKVTALVDKVKEVETNEHFITLRSNRSILYLEQRDILFIESNRNVCIVTTKDGKTKTVNENITSIDERLMLKELTRIDKSTIINISKIVYLGGDKYNKECRLRLEDGSQLSKSLSKIAMNRLYKIVSNKTKNEGQNVV